MANNFYAAIGLIGGGIGALDNIDGLALADGDAATVQTDGTVYFYHLDATSGAAESSPDVIKPDTNAGTKRWIKQSVSGGSGVLPYVRCHDEKAASTNGGTNTPATWEKRTITEDIDASNLCSVAASVITLEAGTYDCYIRLPAFRVNRHKARLRNTTDGTTTLVGTSMYCPEPITTQGATTYSIIKSRFTIAAQKDFELQHRTEVAHATTGFGVSSNFDEVEVYSVAEFWQVSS